MMSVIVFHIMTNDRNEELITKKFFVYVVPQLTRFKLKIAISTHCSQYSLVI